MLNTFHVILYRSVFALLLVVYFSSTFAQPVISSFYPFSGPVGSRVAIFGDNFDSVLSRNVVYFGTVRANVYAANSAFGRTFSLGVTVPAGSAYLPISVNLNGRTAFASRPFKVTFLGDSIFRSSAFEERADLSTGLSPSGISMGDFDEDGKPDIVTVNNNSNSFSVFKNAGQPGEVLFESRVDYETGMSPYAVAVADIDGDGKLDVIITSFSNGLSVFRNTSSNGQIAFSTESSFFTENSPVSLAATDLDGDGKTDIAITHQNASIISVYENTSIPGAISLAPFISVSTGTIMPRCISINNFNEDNLPDLAVAGNSSHSDSVLVFKNVSANGVLGFEITSKVRVPQGAIGMSSADFNDDGKVEIVVASFVSTSTNISVLKNTGSGGAFSFGSIQNYRTGSYPESVFTTDLNGDKRQDIVVGNYLGHSVSLFSNKSLKDSIIFNNKIDYATGVNPRNIFIADVDGDNKPDIATCNLNGNSISVLRNKVDELLETCSSATIVLNSLITSSNYQWQVNAGDGFASLKDDIDYSGTTTTRLTINSVPSSSATWKYRCVSDNKTSQDFTIKIANTWTGAISGEWENPGNWSCGVTPDGFTDVLIRSGSIVVSSEAFCRSLLLEPDASITINAGYTLNVKN